MFKNTENFNRTYILMPIVVFLTKKNFHFDLLKDNHQL